MGNNRNGGQASHSSMAGFIWKNADDLWGDFKHTDFGKIILPFTLLRRLECVLEPTREKVLKAYEKYKDNKSRLERELVAASGYPFYNTSKYTLETLGVKHTRSNLEDYISQFSGNVRTIFQQFKFNNSIEALDDAGILYRICKNFSEIDLHPESVPDRMMSNVYEHLIRRFGAEVNEAAEDFMTPRDVVRLATALLLHPDSELFEQQEGVIRTIYDPACGTGGMFSDAISYIGEMTDPDKVPPTLVPFGQEVEPETNAVCLTSMLIRGEKTDNIKLGSTLSNDQLRGHRFHYGIANPPFGKNWSKDAEVVKKEHEELGFNGRFGPGLPSIDDGSMLFLMNLVHKMESEENGGGRVVIVLSGSPLFKGGAGGGESEIRRWLLENDLVEAIIALPTDLFFRTGIGTYLWVLSNKKDKERQGKVQLINAVEYHIPMQKSEGNKRRMVSEEQLTEILQAYEAFEESEISRIYESEHFGYRKVKVLRPLRIALTINAEGFEKLYEHKAWKKLSQGQKKAWEAKLRALEGQILNYTWADQVVFEEPKQDSSLGKVTKAFLNALLDSFGHKDPEYEIAVDKKGNVIYDSDLTDYEQVPLGTDVRSYFQEEVLPHVPDAVIDEGHTDHKDKGIGKIGYEINFNRYFYKYEAPRPLEEIDADLDKVEKEIRVMLDEVTDG